MAYALNSLGRSTGRKFNMSAIKREMEAKDARVAKDSAIRERATHRRQAFELAHPVNIFTGERRA